MFPFNHKDEIVELPAIQLRTVRPTDVPDSVKKAVGQPQSRTNVINIIDGNVQHEIESIDFELENLEKRKDYLVKLRRKYLKVLEAITDEE